MEKVKLVSENGVSTITLNRPDNYNALDVETLIQLLDIIETVEENEDQIIVITGSGKAFSAGGDINMMEKIHDNKKFDELMDSIEKMTLKLYMMPKLVITAVNGSAAGLGMSLALNSDYIVAQNEARFGMLFAGIGLIPDGGGHFFLKERLGTHHAKQFIWSLEQVKGEKAKRLGFVDLLTDENAADAAHQLAKKLQHAPLQTMIESKMIYHGKQKEELRSLLQQEKHSQLKMRSTEDHKEGIRAFLEKRKPVFQGK